MVSIDGRDTHVSGMLPEFYRQREYRAAWSSGSGPLPQAYALVIALAGAPQEGLSPRYYRIDEIVAALMEIRSELAHGENPQPERVADLDLMLTDAFLTYAHDLLAGHAGLPTVSGEWADNAWDAGLARLLEKALDTDGISPALELLAPGNPAYTGMKKALARYREIAVRGGWPEVPGGRELRRGDQGQRVALLRERLAISRDIQPVISPPEDLFDEALEQAVMKYQIRHGLSVDGIAGPETLEALNVPVEARIRQMETNLERRRQLPRTMQKSYITVNIAAFQMQVVEDRLPVLSMRVVVGKPDWHTPNFSAKMTYLVVNPSWYVPDRIILEELLPKIRTNPGYISQRGFKVYRSTDGNGMEEVAPSDVAWSEVSAQNLDLRLLQPPGPSNPLGRIKFVFPNRFNVYLHDTPFKGQFAEDVRTFSHSCIRIEDPLALAEYLLRDDPRWTRESLLAAIEGGVERAVRLPRPMDIHLRYWTAWVDSDGTVNFRNDIYGRDEHMKMALSEKSAAHQNFASASR